MIDWLDFIIGLPFCLTAALTTVLAARVPLHLLQLESYQLPGYRRAVGDNSLRAILPGVVCAMASAAFFGLSSLHFVWYAGPRALTIRDGVAFLWMFAAMLLSLAVGVAVELYIRKKPTKKPLVVTGRMKRLIVSLGIVTFIVACLMAFVPRWVGAAPLLPIFTPAWVALAAMCAEPVERRINHGFFKDAQRILNERPDLIKIGITGSYGKTSTKFMLAAILGEKYNVLATPSSFNTPMGVTRVVREQLKPEHQVFIAEMGARHVGDIKELCELVHPAIGIITSVGPQHMETFKSQDNITNTKYELIQGLPDDGHAVFIADGAIVEELYGKTGKPRKHLSGERSGGEGLRAQGITTGSWGSRFTIVFADGTKTACETKILGSHNINNLLLAATVAKLLDLTPAQIASGIAKAQPVEHRLQLLPSSNGVTVIDDAFNSNPAGSKAALAVLRTFPPRRILVTPGMVELGEEQDALNRAFGESMKDSVDVVILVGARRTQPIFDGLKASGFDMSAIHQAEDLNAAQAILSKTLKAGDTVLFENDLPDNYNS
ncbi:MAG: UDP-N-acetylmuramoyl-tripeptide--D-alanyl-D-alanine ligase [Oscillospiraceae bacterium]|jgi:UDP-N-acetylmuramoyl-tripeptide--D-alanyl-D-alanine ligase|nr:UDP-N-acetylmuramoyl-tripeptide--D-alanyl-D-alanine ligase [Oscillospiraceae bacterium]